MRLIDANALLDYIDVGHLRPPTEMCFSEYDVKNIIDKMPTIEPERNTGKWIYLGDGYKCPWSCPNCSSCSDERTDYCPMCGAKMEEQE